MLLQFTYTVDMPDPETNLSLCILAGYQLSDALFNLGSLYPLVTSTDWCNHHVTGAGLWNSNLAVLFNKQTNIISEWFSIIKHCDLLNLYPHRKKKM